MVSLVFFIRYFCQTTKLKGKDILPFKIGEAYRELKHKCPTICSILNIIIKPAKRGLKSEPRIYAAAMILLQTRNKNVNAFQKLSSLLLWKGKVKTLVSEIKFYLLPQIEHQFPVCLTEIQSIINMQENKENPKQNIYNCCSQQGVVPTSHIIEDFILKNLNNLKRLLIIIDAILYSFCDSRGQICMIVVRNVIVNPIVVSCIPLYRSGGV